MANAITFTLNGEETVYNGSANTRLLDCLRDDFRLTGTKCGCKEGECGACSVILDGALTNSCMVAMGRLDGANVVTIEGYAKTRRFEALSKAYAEVSAVQCGFCIPGMVLASECILAKNPNPTEEEIRIGISGNLCRCTGYNAIVKAIGKASTMMADAEQLEAAHSRAPGAALIVDSITRTQPFGQQLEAAHSRASGAALIADSTTRTQPFGQQLEAAHSRASGAALIADSTTRTQPFGHENSPHADSKERVMSGDSPVIASSLQEALEARKNPKYIPYAGGTDLMVEMAIKPSFGHKNSPHIDSMERVVAGDSPVVEADENASYLFLHNVPELKQITVDNDFIRIGAASTFTEIIENELTPQILKDACSEIAAPAIRNNGTVGGNIGNGSAKADSVLIFFVTDAKLRLMSAKAERIIPIKEFYLGRKKLALLPDELIVEILIPKNGLDNYYYKKVGARNALAISRISFAAILDVKDGVIANCATAFGAVSDVVIRRDDIDKMLIGKTIEEAKSLRQEYLEAFEKAIVPTRGRVSEEYRKDVCMNLLRDFLDSNGI